MICYVTVSEDQLISLLFQDLVNRLTTDELVQQMAHGGARKNGICYLCVVLTYVFLPAGCAQRARLVL